MPRFPFPKINIQTVRFKLFSAVLVIAVFSGMAGGAGLYYLQKVAKLDAQLSTVNDPLLQVAVNMRNAAGAATTALLRSLALNTHDARYAADAEQQKAAASVDAGYQEMARLFKIEGEDRDLTPYKKISDTLFADIVDLNANLHSLMVETEKMGAQSAKAEDILKNLTGVSKTISVTVENMHSAFEKNRRAAASSVILSSERPKLDVSGAADGFALTRSADSLLYLTERLKQQLEMLLDSKSLGDLKTNRFVLVDNLKNAALEAQVFVNHVDPGLKKNGAKMVAQFTQLSHLAADDGGIFGQLTILINIGGVTKKLQKSVEQDNAAFNKSMGEIIRHMGDEKEEARILALETSDWAKKVVSFFVLLAGVVAIGMAGVLTRSLIRPVR